MEEELIRIVKRSWRMLRDIDSALLGDVFYGRLFIDHPELRSLFKGSMEIQHKKLIDMLGYIVGHLHQLDKLSDDIGALGRRHMQYGVKPQHYQAVGEALIWTLKTGLGNDWTDDVEKAWVAIYLVLSQKMQQPANPVGKA